jgi:hypothetical protein
MAVGRCTVFQGQFGFPLKGKENEMTWSLKWRSNSGARGGMGVEIGRGHGVDEFVDRAV